MGKLAAIIATAAAVTAMSTLTALPASAEPVVMYQLSGTSRCLADTGTNVVLQPCNRTSEAQRWIIPITDSLDWPHNIATGKCLGATAAGDVLGQACASGTTRWHRIPPLGSTFQFRNDASRKCLTAQVTVADCTTTSARWVGLR